MFITIQKQQITQELIERGKDAEIIVIANNPLNAEVINGCKNLKLLSVAFTGIDHIAMDACKANGVIVCNCAGYSTAAVSDLVFGMLIMFYRNLAACDAATRREGTKDGLIGCELEGKKFGVVGTGAIGNECCKNCGQLLAVRCLRTAEQRRRWTMSAMCHWMS